jgi:hypothetical protein
VPFHLSKKDKIVRLFFCLLALAILAIVLVGCNESPPSASNQAPPNPTNPTQSDFDGLSQSGFDSTIRIRNREGTGCGNCVDYLVNIGNAWESTDDLSKATHYEFETNRHVALDRGADAILDIWSDGDLVSSIRTKTFQSWFAEAKSKDVAILRVPLADVAGPVPAIPLAPYGHQLKEGDKVFTVGCSDGRWPRARCGNVLQVSNGLIYYDPESIPGDSGGPVFAWSQERQRWETVGRTAWRMEQKPGKWIGLAMTSDRVRDIRSGRVLSDENWKLPPGALPIADPLALPAGAIPVSQEAQSVLEEPVPEEVSRRRERWLFPKCPDGEINRGKVADSFRPRPIRNGLRFVFSGIKGFVRWSMTATLICGVLALYIGPTILTPLKYDWPYQAIKAVAGLVRNLLKGAN